MIKVGLLQWDVVYNHWVIKERSTGYQTKVLFPYDVGKPYNVWIVNRNIVAGYSVDDSSWYIIDME